MPRLTLRCTRGRMVTFVGADNIVVFVRYLQALHLLADSHDKPEPTSDGSY